MVRTEASLLPVPPSLMEGDAPPPPQCTTQCCDLYNIMVGRGRGARAPVPRLVRPPSVWLGCVLVLVLMPRLTTAVINAGNPDAKRLYDDLLSNYNKLVRPVQNTTDPLTVRE